MLETPRTSCGLFRGRTETMSWGSELWVSLGALVSFVHVFIAPVCGPNGSRITQTNVRVTRRSASMFAAKTRFGLRCFAVVQPL